MYHILLFYKIYDIPNYLTRLCQLIEVHGYLGKASDLEKLNKSINNIQYIIHIICYVLFQHILWCSN